MAHSLSAKKRIRQNASHRARNRWRKQAFRTAIKEYKDAILHASEKEAERQLTGLYKLLDRTAAKGAIHKNTAARYKSRLAERLHKKRAGTASGAE